MELQDSRESLSRERKEAPGFVTLRCVPVPARAWAVVIGVNVGLCGGGERVTEKRH